MKTYVAAFALLFSSAVGEANDWTKSFSGKIQLPPLTLADTARNPFASNDAPAPNEARDAVTVKPPRQVSYPSEDKFIFSPREDVDYRLVVKAPDEAVDYKLIVKTAK